MRRGAHGVPALPLPARLFRPRAASRPGRADARREARRGEEVGGRDAARPSPRKARRRSRRVGSAPQRGAGLSGRSAARKRFHLRGRSAPPQMETHSRRSASCCVQLIRNSFDKLVAGEASFPARFRSLNLLLIRQKPCGSEETSRFNLWRLVSCSIRRQQVAVGSADRQKVHADSACHLELSRFFDSLRTAVYL